MVLGFQAVGKEAFNAFSEGSGAIWRREVGVGGRGCGRLCCGVSWATVSWAAALAARAVASASGVSRLLLLQSTCETTRVRHKIISELWMILYWISTAVRHAGSQVIISLCCVLVRWDAVRALLRSQILAVVGPYLFAHEIETRWGSIMVLVSLIRELKFIVDALWLRSFLARGVYGSQRFSSSTKQPIRWDGVPEGMQRVRWTPSMKLVNILRTALCLSPVLVRPRIVFLCWIWRLAASIIATIIVAIWQFALLIPIIVISLGIFHILVRN